jgi:hypothetical protein
LLIGIDADESHTAIGELLIQIVEALGVEPGERTLGTKEDERENWAVAKVAQSLGCAAIVAEDAIGELLTQGRGWRVD